MTNLQNLIDEITSLEIKISEGENVYNLDYYNQSEHEYKNRLEQLKSKALTEIINLTDEQIKRQITRLEAEHEKLKRLETYFNEQYKLYFHGTGFNADEFIQLLQAYVIISFPERKLNHFFNAAFMYCLSDAIMYKVAYLRGFIETVKQLTQQKPAAETPNQEPAQDLQPETTAEIIAGILEPLQVQGAFQDPKHIDKIINALVDYAETGVAPENYNCMNIHISSRDFYTPFKVLHKVPGFTLPSIAKVLHYFIYANDGSRNAIKETSIVQNIKRKYSKII